MTKIIKCRDVGFDCDGEIRAESEAEALQKAAAHAASAHGVTEVTPAIVAKIKSVMTEEPA